MNAMTIMRRCRAAQDDTERIQQRIEQRRDLLDSISAPPMDPNGGGHGSGDKDKTGRILADIDLLEREKAARQEAWNAERVAALSLLEMVPDLEGKILHDYYVKRMDTGEIARKRKYTAGYVRKTKRSGEQLLEMLGAERVKSVLPAWYLNKEKEEGT